MNMNYFIIGTAIIIVGAGVFYLLNRGGKSHGLTAKQITIKNTDNIKLSDIGPWLKEKNVDLDDFVDNTHLVVFKNLQGNLKDLHLPEEIISKVTNLTHKKVLCFVLSDKDYNTKEVLILVGDSIDQNLEVKLTKDVTELNIR